MKRFYKLFACWVSVLLLVFSPSMRSHASLKSLLIRTDSNAASSFSLNRLSNYELNAIDSYEALITDWDSSRAQVFADGPLSGLKASFTAIGSSETLGSYAIPDYDSGGFYKLSFSGSAYQYLDTYIFSSSSGVNNIVIASADPLLSMYGVGYDGSIVHDVLNYALLGEYDGYTFYCISIGSATGVAFRSTSTILFSEFNAEFGGGKYYQAVEDMLPYMPGVYDGTGYAVKYPGLRYGGYGASFAASTTVYRFPVMCVALGGAGRTTLWKFESSSGFLHSDSLYTFVYDVSNVTGGHIFIDGLGTFLGDVSGNVFEASVNGADNSLGSVGFGFTRSSSTELKAICVSFVTSNSDDVGVIPPDDGGDSGDGSAPNYSSALSAIGNNLLKLLSSVGSGTTTIVNNIVNQTTQITNTITNTVTNMTQQITQGLSDVKQGITDKLQGVQEEISGSIEEANKAQIESDQKLHEEQIKADKENTDQITDGYDNSGFVQENEKLEQSINDYDKVESEIFDEAGGFVSEFEYPSVDSLPGGIVKALAFVGGFLQSIFLCMGNFGSVITFSLTMIFVMVVVGYHRIRS